MMITLLLLCIATSNQQLTWYEQYERGEKHYKRGDYQACINDMNEVLQEKKVPKRNQFTRAVQKIDYKPFYYLALSYHELDDLPKAYDFAQKAYKGEVVAQSPLLQSDLARILESYRSWITSEHQRYAQERDTMDTRRNLLELLNKGDLDRVEQELSKVTGAAEFEDIRLQLTYRKSVVAQAEQVRRQMFDSINERIDNEAWEDASVLYQGLKDNLSQEQQDQLTKRLKQRPPPVVKIEDPVVPPIQDLEPDPREDANAQLLAEFQTKLDNMESLKLQADQRLVLMESRNRELEKRLDDEEQDSGYFKPEIFLEADQTGTKVIRLIGHAVSPVQVGSWSISLNGVTQPLASDLFIQEGNTYRFDHQLEAKDFGEQELVLTVNDELGGKAEVRRQLVIPKPFYLTPVSWAIAMSVILGTLLVLFVKRSSRRKQARLRHYNPYIAGSPVRSVSMFYGRDDLVNRIQHQVHKNSFMIHGARRIGKTSLLLQLKKNLGELESDAYRFFPCFIDLQGVVEEDLFHHMMAEVLSQASDWDIDLTDLSFEEGDIRYQSRQFSKDIKRIITQLKEKHQEHILVVLLMDEVDVLNEFGEKTNQKLRGIFMKDFAEHLTCVMAGIHLKKEWESSGSPWYNFFEEIPVDPFDDKAARKLVTDPIKGIFTFQKAAVDMIVRETGRHPYLIQKVCVSLIGEKLKANRFHISESDVREALKMFNDEIKRNRNELYHKSMG